MQGREQVTAASVGVGPEPAQVNLIVSQPTEAKARVAGNVALALLAGAVCPGSVEFHGDAFVLEREVEAIVLPLARTRFWRTPWRSPGT